MILRQAVTALAFAGCCCVSAQADARQRRAQNDEPVQIDVARLAPQGEVERLNFNPSLPAPARRSGILESWSVGDGMTVGVGRYSVAPIVRPRTHTERAGTGMEQRNSAVAGAGLSLVF